MITESSKIYTNLNAYIEENSIFTNVRLAFFGRYLVLMAITDGLFVAAFLLHVLLVACYRRCARSTKKRRKRK